MTPQGSSVEPMPQSSQDGDVSALLLSRSGLSLKVRTKNRYGAHPALTSYAKLVSHFNSPHKFCVCLPRLRKHDWLWRERLMVDEQGKQKEECCDL
eukprot:scaffold31056_cov26-Cyclotella_meneghiniana.AAC.1